MCRQPAGISSESRWLALKGVSGLERWAQSELLVVLMYLYAIRQRGREELVMERGIIMANESGFLSRVQSLLVVIEFALRI